MFQIECKLNLNEFDNVKTHDATEQICPSIIWKSTKLCDIMTVLGFAFRLIGKFLLQRGFIRTFSAINAISLSNYLLFKSYVLNSENVIQNLFHLSILLGFVIH